MKIANFNTHSQAGTYHAWNKQYLYHINAKITSLQDYITYNYPEYLILNSPNTAADKKVDLTQGVMPYQVDISEHSVSLFFPSRLSWRQGFYNESNYGDGVLMYWDEQAKKYYSYVSAAYKTPEYFVFDRNNKSYITSDTNKDNYITYIKNISQPIELRDKILTWNTDSENSDTDTKSFKSDFTKYVGFDYYVDIDYVTVRDSADVEIFITKEPTYNSKTGCVNGSFRVSVPATMSQLARKLALARAVSITIKVIPTSERQTFKLVEDGDKKLDFVLGNRINNNWPTQEFLLIHKTNTIDYGAKSTLCWGADNKFSLQVVVPDSVWYYYKDQIYNHHDQPYVIEDISTLKPYRDFPSGYICILNKRPIGKDNDTNIAKQALSSFLIAPIGNGAFYYLSVVKSDIEAIYTPNELGNFINQVRMNLGQNLRFIMPETRYISNSNFIIQNIKIEDSGVVDNIVDHQGNLWTGKPYLIGEPTLSTTKEDVFMDVSYFDTSLALERHLIHGFGVDTIENVSPQLIELKIF